MNTEFDKNIIPLLEKKLKDSDVPIKIFCPYLTKAAEHILSSVKPENCEIYTRLELMDLLAGASDINTLIHIFQKGFKLFEIKNLHAKIVLMGDDFAIVGSQNLTTKSSSNKELTAVFSDKAEIAEIAKNVEDWIIQRAEITKSRLDTLADLVTKLKPEFQALLDYGRDHQRLELMADSLISQLKTYEDDCVRYSEEQIQAAQEHNDQIRIADDVLNDCVHQKIQGEIVAFQKGTDDTQEYLKKLESDLKQNWISTSDDTFKGLGNNFSKLDDIKRQLEQLAGRPLEKDKAYNATLSNFLQEMQMIHLRHLKILNEYKNRILKIRNSADTTTTSVVNGLPNLLKELLRIETEIAEFSDYYQNRLKQRLQNYVDDTNEINAQIKFWLNLKKEDFLTLLSKAKRKHLCIIDDAQNLDKRICTIIDHRATLNEFEGSLHRLGKDGSIPKEIAANLVALSCWWLTQRHHPVRAIRIAENLLGDEKCWYIEFGRNRFLVTRSVLRCQETLNNFIIQARLGDLQSDEELFYELRLDLRKSVANNVTGHEYLTPYPLGKSSSSYSGIEKDMVFGSHSIDTESFIQHLLGIVKFNSFKNRIWQT